MKKYEILDISGDVGLKAFGKNINEVFINAATGMYSLITNLNLIEEKKTIEIEVKSHSLEGLFVSYLNELIFYFDAYGFIGRRIVITEFTPSPVSSTGQALTLPPQGGGIGGGETSKLKASISGEDFDPKRHESKLLIKAATYHKLRIEKIVDTWKAKVIFDI
jgi:SHS2 domain-containing protein